MCFQGYDFRYFLADGVEEVPKSICIVSRLSYYIAINIKNTC